MRKIKWGVLGTAYIFARDTAEGMRQAENCELYAIAGRNPEKVAAYKEKYGFQKAYDSYDALLADPEVEAVYVPLPNTMHHEWTIKALRAGKHVLCEKPVAANTEEAQEMFDEAKKNGVYLMEAFAYLHSPYIEAVRKEIESGTIGKVRYMEAALITSDYDISNIRMRRETLGGAMYDLGVYSASLVLRMFGEEPVRVQASCSKTVEDIDRYTTVLMEYADGRCAQIDAGMVLATEKNLSIDRFQIHGTEGSIQSLEFGFNRPGELSYAVVSPDQQVQVKTVQVPNNYKLEVEQLGRCITDGEAPAVSEAFSLANARTVDRILEACDY